MAQRTGSSTISTAEIKIRWAVKADLARMVEIEESAYGPADSWNAEDFWSVLSKPDNSGLVAEPLSMSFARQAVGLLVYQQLPASYRVLNLTVHPDFQRLGVGSQLLNRLKKNLYGKRLVIEGVVHERSLGVQLFLRSQGFKAVSISRDYYADGEAGYSFQYTTE